MAEFAFGGDGDVDVDDSSRSDLIGECSGGASGGDFQIENQSRDAVWVRIIE